jgi:hypothetical protein
MSPVLAVAFAVPATILLVAFIYLVLLRPSFRTVVPGRVYRSRAYAPAALEARQRRYRFRTVIDLRKPCREVEEERSCLERLGVEHVHLPSKQVPDGETVRRFLDRIASCPGPVLLHCTHGRGRAVLFSAIYLMEFEGWSPSRARRIVWWRALFGNFSQVSRKGRFVAAYRSALGGVAGG